MIYYEVVIPRSLCRGYFPVLAAFRGESLGGFHCFEAIVLRRGFGRNAQQPVPGVLPGACCGDSPKRLPGLLMPVWIFDLLSEVANKAFLSMVSIRNILFYLIILYLIISALLTACIHIQTPPQPFSLEPTSTSSMGSIKGHLAEPSRYRNYYILYKILAINDQEMSGETGPDWVIKIENGKNIHSFSFQNLETGQYVIYSPPNNWLDYRLQSPDRGTRYTFVNKNFSKRDIVEFNPELDNQLAFYPPGVITNWDSPNSLFNRKGYMQNKMNGKVIVFNITPGTVFIINNPIENNDLGDLKDWEGHSY